MRNVLAVLVAALVLARAAPAGAADPPPRVRQVAMDLEYKLGPGTESCFSKRGMEVALIGALSYDPFKPVPEPEIHVEIDVTRRRGEFHSDIILTLADGNRLWVEEQSESTCADMLRNAALVVSGHTLLYVLKIPKQKPPAEAPAPADAPPNPPAPGPSPPSPPPSPPSPPLTEASKAPLSVVKAAPPSDRKPDEWRLRAGAAGELSFGLVPGAGGGASVGLGFQRGEHVSINFDLRALVALSPNDVLNHKVRPYFFGGSFDVCLQQQVAAPLVFACPVIHAGAWIIPLNQTSHTAYKELRPLAAVGGRLGADWQLTASYSLRTSMDFAYSALQHDTEYNGKVGSAALPLIAVATLGIVSATPLANPTRR